MSSPESACAVIVTDHAGVDYAAIAGRAAVVSDARNAPRGIEGAHIFRSYGRKWVTA